MDLLNDDFIATLCEEALLKNEEFRSLQKELAHAYDENDIDLYSELTLRLQIITSLLCFKLARVEFSK